MRGMEFITFLQQMRYGSCEHDTTKEKHSPTTQSYHMAKGMGLV
mgnify:FL=1